MKNEGERKTDEIGQGGLYATSGNANAQTDEHTGAEAKKDVKKKNKIK